MFRDGGAFERSQCGTKQLFRVVRAATIFEARRYDNDDLNNSFRANNALKYASANYGSAKFGVRYAFSNEAGGFDTNDGANSLVLVQMQPKAGCQR